MKRLLVLLVVILVSISVSGCCGKLKKANANLTNEIAACNDALATSKNDIAAKDKPLQVKAQEIKTKEVQVKEQSAAFAQMQ
jgi:hypothetical protein